MTSRIESYTVGGQILISESVRREVGEILRIDAQLDVFPKGAENPLRVYDIGGIAGGYNLVLTHKEQPLGVLVQQIPIRYTVLEGKDVGTKEMEGSVVRQNGSSHLIQFTSMPPEVDAYFEAFLQHANKGQA